MTGRTLSLDLPMAPTVNHLYPRRPQGGALTPTSRGYGQARHGIASAPRPLSTGAIFAGHLPHCGTGH